MNKKTEIISIVLVSLIILTGIFAYLQFNNVWPFAKKDNTNTEEKTEWVDRAMVEWEILETGTDKETGISYQKQYNSDLGITVKIPTTWHIPKESNMSHRGSFSIAFSPVGVSDVDNIKPNETFAILMLAKNKDITLLAEPNLINALNSMRSDINYTKIKYKNFDSVFFKEDVNNPYRKEYTIFMSDTSLFFINLFISSPSDNQKLEKYKTEANFILDSLEFDKN
ncbi:MAG: hypothetical protein CO137_03820 [Candidatus Magasanikbacteria bacterium CG_4_9_14_3_um_filter_32_9]|uniref:Uncharacterized protein n=1 Tax=Candidatus Magasanikbacteria bacterium CG_4_9_14_3_um_filter_32_9 TaxID=1974644 RepID=A0A2M7Z5V2_9BACT|nr:MAG: hypothetical protein CO137_03820 [Candidatus Magasanikbacteria bacterium CG_4_9_14_3_um_filter_32_9]